MFSERPKRGLKLKRRENIQPSEETLGSHQNTNNERGGKLPDIPGNPAEVFGLDLKRLDE